MTRADKTPATAFLAMSQELRSEDDLHVIDSLSGHLDYIRGALPTKEQKTKYDKFLQDQFGPLAKQLGWKPRSSDTDEQKALRATLLDVLGDAGDSGAIAAARELVNDYLANPDSVDATLVGSAFTVAAQNGDPAFYDRCMEGFTSAKSNDEYYRYLYALAEFRRPELLRHTIQLIDEGKLRQQDYPRMFGVLLSNPDARDLAWQYLKDHWDSLSQKVTSFGGAGAVSALGNSCSAEMRDDVRKFFSDHPAPGAERAVKQSLERIDDCLAFRNKQSQSLQQWLDSRQSE